MTSDDSGKTFDLSGEESARAVRGFSDCPLTLTEYHEDA